MAKNIIDVDHVSIRFNLSSEKVNNLKEYTINGVWSQETGGLTFGNASWSGSGWT